MIDPAKKTVEVEAEDEYALLYSWLEALLVKFEIEGMLFSKFKIDRKDTARRIQTPSQRLGRKIRREKHPQKVAVKAVTYHRMEIIKEIDKVTLEFILDI